MQIFLRILKEIGIGLVFLLLILGLLALAFYEKVPFRVCAPFGACTSFVLCVVRLFSREILQGGARDRLNA